MRMPHLEEFFFFWVWVRSSWIGGFRGRSLGPDGEGGGERERWDYLCDIFGRMGVNDLDISVED